MDWQKLGFTNAGKAKMDTKGRISIKKYSGRRTSGFKVLTNQTGQVVLLPMVDIPLEDLQKYLKESDGG